ncbi:BCS1 N terminal-domain-containing protein [Thelonectria olida]|uniref:BCS1 N terminal-domain-containing protein n=1 Tax=Thelonectria olida TaxID=1576542 RepID=A0A9P9AKZ5_9HYPO|nr:BCS1 N terminal-domain-containing protein [Thelonectria olida]
MMDSETLPKMDDSGMGQGLFARLFEMFFPGLTLLPYFAAFGVFLKYILESWSEFITARFISTVELRAQDETYNYMMNWVSRNSLSRDNYRLHASATITNEGFNWIDEGKDKHDVGDDDETDAVAREVGDLRSKISLYNAKPLHWTPAFGTHFFRYENRILAFTRSFESGNYTSMPRQPERLAISCLGRDATVLKRLLYNARIDFLEKQKGRTSIFRATKFDADDEMSWTRCMSKATRPMSTIALEESLKQGLIKDLRRYLDPQTKHWYANRGIPYRRGYLFSGPPGTGKTSLTLAAAGLMGLDIYMINLNSPRLNEDNLASLFQELPSTCLVLMEDIDATGLTQKRNLETASMGSRGRKKRDRERIALSGLLNIIDGAAAQEGRVLVMTSNHTENIDPALLRPGRIDFTIKFGLATSETAATLFSQMYDAPGAQGEGPEAEKKAIGRDKEAASAPLRSQALEFGEKIPDLALSPAAIQGFLLTHQDDPAGALAAVDGWVQETLDQRKTEPSVPEEVFESGEGSSESEADDDGDSEEGSDVEADR